MKSQRDIREFECVSCNATFTGYKDGMDVYSTVENESRPERLHVSGCPQCGCDDCNEVENDEVDDGYGDDLEGSTAEVSTAEGGTVDTKREECAGTCSTPLPPSPHYVPCITDDERVQWIEQNPSLCSWWKSTNHTMTRFIELWHDHIDYYIKNDLIANGVKLMMVDEPTQADDVMPLSPSPSPSSLFYEVLIQPCASGFGEWAPSEANGEGWDDIDNLDSEIRASVDVMDWAELENTDADIRGRIHRQSELMQIFAWRDDEGGLHYGGIVEVAPTPSPNYCETCRGVDALHWNNELGLWICANCEAGIVEGDTSKCIN